jgi:D-alanine-D-alanine ligase
MQILILHNTPKDNRQDDLDTLEQVQEISVALAKSGHNVNIGAGNNLIDIEKLVKQHTPQIVFNMVESFCGSDQNIHLVPAYLESIGIPYTGCSAASMLITGNKITAKKIMRGADIPTAAYFDITSKTGAAGRFIVKSAIEHASLGIDANSVVNSAEAARDLIAAKTAEYGGIWFAEQYIEGREFNISVMGRKNNPQIMPLAEIIFNDFATETPKIVDYAAKWDAESDSYNSTMRVFIDEAENRALATKIRDITEKCWYEFDLCGYARVDFRVDNAGNPWVLEVNTNPCLASDAGFMAATAQGKMTYLQTLNYIMEIALNATAKTEITAFA